jgi:hypothetical protein
MLVAKWPREGVRKINRELWWLADRRASGRGGLDWLG